MSLEGDQFQRLMDAISTTKDSIERQFTSKLDKLQQEVAANQASCSQEVMSKLNKRPYQFRRKGNEAQFLFNESVDERIDAAKRQLDLVPTPDDTTKQTLKRAVSELDQGKEAIRVRQKHIRIADRSDWGVVAEYEADELASDSDDEKKLYRARKERETKKRQAAAALKRKPRQEGAARQPSGTGAPRPPAPRTKPIGPCYTCAGWGHLAATCPKGGRQQPYPLYQPVVGGLDPPACHIHSHVMLGTGKGMSETSSFDSTTVSGPSKNSSALSVNNTAQHIAGKGSGVDSIQENNQGQGTSGLLCVNDSWNDYRALSAHWVGDQGLPHKECADKVVGLDKLEYCSSVSPGGKTEDPAQKVKGSIQEVWTTDTAIKGPGDSVEFDALLDYEVLELARSWELEEGDTQIQVVDVQGRLRRNVKFWSEVLGAPGPVIDWIENGYKLPLQFMPTPFEQCNHKSALGHHEFVSNSVLDLIKNRCVREVQGKPLVCSPLSVVANREGKFRLVLNLRHLNQFLRKDHFKYEDLRIAMLMFEREDFLIKFDLKSGYHHLDIFEAHQTYLGFSWTIDRSPRYFVFAVLPFGLATACYAFTKLLRPLIGYWRSQGLRAVLYLDDGIVAAKGLENSNRMSVRIRQDLVRAGLIVNEAKSQWEPVRKLTWLGFEIDLEIGQLTVPEDKLVCLCELLQSLLERAFVPAKVLASAIGRIISMSLALGPVTRLMTRSLYTVLNSKGSWCTQLQLSAEAKQELSFWLARVSQFNGQDLWPKPSAVRVVYSDASNTGYGGYTVEHGGQIANGLWDKEEAQQSSTWRELRAVRMVLESFESQLQNERVRWFTDNQNVVWIVLHGSKKPALQQEALAIFDASVRSRIRLEPEWIPREGNQLADYISRIVDYDDWMLNPVVFRELDSRWGPHTIDRFANWYNNQLPRFNARYWCPGAEAIDAFTCDWSCENNWWCPPLYLVPRLLRHAQLTKALGTLIIPQWVSAPFWPLLFPDGSHPAKFVTGIQELPRVETLFVSGRLGCNLFKGVPNTPVIAMRLNFQAFVMATSGTASDTQ